MSSSFFHPHKLFGTGSQGYRHLRRISINGMVKKMCREEEVGFVDGWDSFVGKEEMYLTDGLMGEGLSGAVASGMGKVGYINKLGRWFC